MEPNNQRGYYQKANNPASSAMPGQQPATDLPRSSIDSAALQETAAEATDQQAMPEGVQEEYDDDTLSGEEVSWVAHEYIHHEKGATWFITFAVVIVILMALSIFVMKSWSFAVLLAVIPVAVIVYSKRPPRELTYTLTDEGLLVDDKLHNFADFKSFGVIRDGEEFSVMLIPTQRFQPSVTVYFPEESGEAIVDALGSRLPMKNLKLDVVDRIVRLLRL